MVAGLAPITGARSSTGRVYPCFVVMTAKPRTLAQLAAHPWVESVSDERSSGCGIWVYLKPGYQWDGSHTVHESTVRECCAAFSAIVENPADELLQDAPRPVLPGEQTPPPARSHGDAAPTLPELQAVGLAKLAEARTQRRQRREAAAMEMEGVRPLLNACVAMSDDPRTGDGWILWDWLDQAGRAVDTAADLGWIETGDGLGLTIQCCVTDAGRAALASHAAG